MDLRLLSRHLGGSRLVRDYLDGSATASTFYQGAPGDAPSYRTRARQLSHEALSARLSDAAEVVRPAGPRGEDALRRVVERQGFFVTTGQQPGLFGGPLYSLYKALTAVRLAEELQPVVGRPVMPLFWIASDDHDWAEANHAHVIDPGNRLHRITVGPTTDPLPRALAQIPLGDRGAQAIAELAACFPPNDYREGYLDLLREAYHPGSTLASAYADLMAALLRDTPIGLVDGAGARLKELARPILRAEAEDPLASEEALTETAGHLTAAGYRLQVPLPRGATNLFFDTRQGRDRLLRASGGFRLRRSGREFSSRRILAVIDESVDLVSPNVLLRPVVEGFVFPTLAYVAGPGEVAYFGQLAALFRRHGVEMPVVAPRASLLVVERKVARVLERLDVTVDDVRDVDLLQARFARDEMPDEMKNGLRRWREGLETRASEVSSASAAIDPVLRGAVTKARNSGLAALGALEKKVIRAIKRRSETVASQIAKAGVNLWPGSKPQDRVLSPLQYTMRYGPGVVTALRERIRVLAGENTVEPAGSLPRSDETP
ncbi:MAG: bacillithiol biosynthesis cysteine-adding enzyme BshC [Gemmatimonadota bacterium]|nr:bacillithiol biosynthesis cysteine-adding enzyme BshC [Gemmatimonadota bacterium]